MRTLIVAALLALGVARADAACTVLAASGMNLLVPTQGDSGATWSACLAYDIRVLGSSVAVGAGSNPLIYASTIAALAPNVTSLYMSSPTIFGGFAADTVVIGTQTADGFLTFDVEAPNSGFRTTNGPVVVYLVAPPNSSSSLTFSEGNATNSQAGIAYLGESSGATSLSGQGELIISIGSGNGISLQKNFGTQLIGINTLSPLDGMDVNTTSTFRGIVNVVSGSSVVIASGGQLVANGDRLAGQSVSTVTSCGNGAVLAAGSGNAGLITTGAASQTCSITWSPSYPTGSLCSAFDITRSTTSPSAAFGVKSATFTFAGKLTANDQIKFSCQGY